MGNRTVVEKDTKSMAGEGVLPLPGFVREALKTFRATQAADAWRRAKGTRARATCSWMNSGPR